MDHNLKKSGIVFTDFSNSNIVFTDPSNGNIVFTNPPNGDIVFTDLFPRSGRPTHYIFHSSGKDSDTWTFWLELEVRGCL